MASTIIRIDPPAVPVSYQTPLQKTSADVPKITFKPVDRNVITEIMGVITLGLSEIDTLDKDQIPALLYKWNVFLLRMNDWMIKNKEEYPKFAGLPELKIPGNLHFLGEMKSDDSYVILANAQTTGLGPLLPADRNTMLNAMLKGSEKLQKCTSVERLKNLYSFVQHLCSLAYYAVKPNKNLKNKIVQRSVNSENQRPITMMDGEEYLIEGFENKSKNKMVNLEKVPMWGWILALIVVGYLFLSKSGNTTNIYKGGKPLIDYLK